MMQENTPETNLLEGKNAVWEALKAERPIEKILLSKTINQESVRGITGLARGRNIKIEWAPKEKLDTLSTTGRHQGVLAVCAAHTYADLDEVLDGLKDSAYPPLIVLLDEIQDPHNLGAIIRTAECCGAHGVIVPERRSAGLNPAAVKASAGALSYILVARVGNLSRTLADLKEKGLWVIGCDMSGGDIREADLSGPMALVVGSEGEGISHLVLEGCDKVVSIPLKGQIASLNASVAAGIALYEVMRTRSGQ